MINKEPIVSVGIIEGEKEINGFFEGFFELHNSIRLKGAFKVVSDRDSLFLFDDENIEVAHAPRIQFKSLDNSPFTLANVKIGKEFHWQKKEDQKFKGDLQIIASNGGVIAVNRIGIEDYLESVISSEMSAEAPAEFLKAHATTSRSWLVAMLEKRKRSGGDFQNGGEDSKNEIVRWYDREDHSLFDVCADDHCQRYQGITKIISKSAVTAVEETRGIFLVYNDEICDARFSKACGGRTELFENCWQNISFPYLQSVSDSTVNLPPAITESDAKTWILSNPDVFCNSSDAKILKQILPSYDRETADFFRWKIEYSREELEQILRIKSGIDFGTLQEIIPLQRGPSGRIFKLKIIGTNRTLTVGKELEIRRWLSKSHLYSSAFVVEKERGADGFPIKFNLRGAGWGHGVGLCQIGAAVMATKGFSSESILSHYFSDVEIRKLY